MKLHKSILIEKACSGSASRPVQNSVYLDMSGTGPNSPARLFATNGRILAIVPVLADPADTAGYITAEALKASRKAGSKSSDTSAFTANGVCKMPDGQEFARPDLGNYPNVQQVIPKDETVFSVTLDPELLYALAQAIGSERGVTLQISGEGKAIRVLPHVNPRAENAKGATVGFAPACQDAMGVIMPIARINA